MGETLDDGPFFHGTKADLRIGDLLTAGFRSNYRPEIVMNHIYFTATSPRLAPEALQSWRERLAVLRDDERGVNLN